MLDKLAQLDARFREIEDQLADPEVLARPDRLRELTKEHRRLQPIAQAYQERRSLDAGIAGAEDILAAPEEEEEVRQMARDEGRQLSARRDALDERIKLLLLPRDPDDDKDVVLEIRAAAGGDEAALFAGDLFRMYAHFGEGRGWRMDVLSSSPTPGGGFKEVIVEVSGDEVFRLLKHEGGVHRVQRVPATEAQGRIHTSTATVAVLPVAEEVDVVVDPNDLRIDVYRSTGPGGQSVNTTDSAVRITHLPTGLVVTCQDEKSQHKNKAKALKVLRSRLLDAERAAAHAERGGLRRGMIGSGERSEKVRTYNFPQNRVTDHRIGRSWHRLDGIIAGDLDEVVSEVAAAARAELLRRETQDG